MSVKIIQERLDSYKCQSQQDEENVLKEISQEIALAALSRTDFYKLAAFQGGTCLRILYNLERFSEDLDFVFKKQSSNFYWEHYLRSIESEFNSYGINLEVQDRSKVDGAVKKAFVKSDSVGKVLQLNYEARANIKKIKIKLEVDTNPPMGSSYQNRYLDFPFPFPITVQDLPSLFAGKSHALLCREYVKGRDWYDFLWYVSRNTPLNYQLLSSAMDQQGPWQGRRINITKDWYREEMEKKIKGIDWEVAKKDISRFLKPKELESLNLWKEEYFLDRLKKHLLTNIS